MKWEDFVPLHSEDELFAFVSVNKRHCNGTDLTKCTITGLSTYTEYTVCLAVCHPNTSSIENEASTIPPGNLRELSTTTDEPPTDLYELTEFSKENYTCATESCVQSKTLPKG